MGTYASNTYELTIPMTEVGKITTEYRDLIHGGYYEFPTEWQDDTPEALVDMILGTCGSDAIEDDGFRIEGSDLIIATYSSGKTSDTDPLFAVLAKHGTTGTIESEIEGEWWLASFKDGAVTEHKGVITYPTYEASS